MILIDQIAKDEFVAHKMVEVLVCGLTTSFQTSSGFNIIYSKETNEQFKICMTLKRQTGMKFVIPSLNFYKEIL